MNVLEAPVGAAIEVRERRDNYAEIRDRAARARLRHHARQALRRVLLSPIPGAAVTYMKIDGVLHEFSTIPGIVEDTIALMLNLKGLPVSSNSEEPKVLTLAVSGARRCTAADIVPDARRRDPRSELSPRNAVREGREADHGDRRRETAAAT